MDFDALNIVLALEENGRRNALARANPKTGGYLVRYTQADERMVLVFRAPDSAVTRIADQTAFTQLRSDIRRKSHYDGRRIAAMRTAQALRNSIADHDADTRSSRLSRHVSEDSFINSQHGDARVRLLTRHAQR